MKKLSVSCGLIAGFLGFSQGLLMINVAWAMPAIGDDALFSSVRVNAGAVTTGTFEMKLVSVDSASGKWTEKQISIENGVAKNQNQQIPGSALLTDGNVALILSNCVSMNGILQTVTVPAGNFPTCAIPSNSDFSSGTLWIAKGVAFGIVQEDYLQPDGTHTVLQLVSQTLGN